MTAESYQFYLRNDIVNHFSRASGWQNPGEELTIRRLAPLIRCKRILDIGIGGGRTIGLFGLLSEDYVGVDFSEPMVVSAKEKYPDVDLRVADARNLAEFETDGFDCVIFSYNGIDTMDEDDRRAVFASIRRVLDDGGVFVFSTLNRDGRSFREWPLQIRRPGTAWQHSGLAVANLVWRNAQDPRRISRRMHNWRESRQKYVEHEGWATSSLASTDFLLMNHFVTLARLRIELSDAGFDVVGIYGSDKDFGPLPDDATTSSDDSFHAVARRRS